MPARFLIVSTLLLLGACAGRSPQEAPVSSADAATSVPPTSFPATTFPGDWLGEWAGEVVMAGPEGERGRFQMRRIVRPTEDPDVYTWTTIYSGEAGDQTREYSLLVRDRATGSYAIDEHNGIVLEARYLGGLLYSWFEVQGTELVIREELSPDATGELAWTFEVLTSRGETVPTGEEIPVVSTLPNGIQRASLRRVEISR
jgi:hypothetical protein